MVCSHSPRNGSLVLRVEATCPIPKLKGKAWPERRVVSTCIQLPVGALRDSRSQSLALSAVLLYDNVSSG